MGTDALREGYFEKRDTQETFENAVSQHPGHPYDIKTFLKAAQVVSEEIHIRKNEFFFLLKGFGGT